MGCLIMSRGSGREKARGVEGGTGSRGGSGVGARGWGGGACKSTRPHFKNVHFFSVDVGHGFSLSKMTLPFPVEASRGSTSAFFFVFFFFFLGQSL